MAKTNQAGAAPRATSKDAVRVATTAAIANLSAASVSIDGVTLVEGDAVLVKNTASPDGVVALSAAYNGLYEVGPVSGGLAALTRRADAQATTLRAGALVTVCEGTQNADSLWLLSTNNPIVLGTTALTWVEVGADVVLAASNVTVTPVGSISSVNAQNAFAELDADLDFRNSVVLDWVLSGDRANPAAATENVSADVEWAFNTTAGVVGDGSVIGVPVLLAAAGGVGAHEFNTSTGRPAPASNPNVYRVLLRSTAGNEILDGAGNPVWALISTTARTTGGTYTLRFFSGEWGSGTEAAYTMAQSYNLFWRNGYALYDVQYDSWADPDVVKLGKVAAGIAPATITDTEMATANKDGLAATASLRTLGTGAQQAAAGDHGHASTAITADSSGLTNITGSTIAAQMTSIDGQLGGTGRALIAGDASTQIELLFAEATEPFVNSGAYGALPFSRNTNATLLTRQAGFLGDYALSISNNNDRGGLTTGNTSACEYGTALTLSGWFRYGSTNGGFVITKLYNLAGQMWGAGGKFASVSLVAYADSPQAHYNIGGTNQSLVGSANGICPAGAWAFIAVTYDGHHMRIYANGALVATSVDHNASIAWGSHGPWCIGGLDATSLGGGTSNQYGGLIYRPRVENVVRNRAYLAEVYYRGMGLPAAGL